MKDWQKEAIKSSVEKYDHAYSALWAMALVEAVTHGYPCKELFDELDSYMRECQQEKWKREEDTLKTREGAA